jgi:SAM-dependent methyltransferase
MELRKTFEAVADIYAEVRRGYPGALFEDLQATGALGTTKAVMEVGCGTGQATGELAQRAERVLALDPGQGLVANARRGVTADNVEFVVSTFEDFESEPASFDLIASAQAWHWVDPAVGFAKAAQTLRPGGYLAIFGHVPMMAPEALQPAFRAAFDTWWPGAWGRPSPQDWYLPDGPVPSMVAASGLFQPTEHRGYTWSWTLDPELFGRYLRTDSSYHLLAETPRFALFDALAAAVADHGGIYESAWETHLYLARKA